jgi:hypothetical protein
LHYFFILKLSRGSNGRAISTGSLWLERGPPLSSDNSGEEEFVPADDNVVTDDTGNTDNHQRYRQHRQVPTMAASPKTNADDTGSVADDTEQIRDPGDR